MKKQFYFLLLLFSFVGCMHGMEVLKPDYIQKDILPVRCIRYLVATIQQKMLGFFFAEQASTDELVDEGVGCDNNEFKLFNNGRICHKDTQELFDVENGVSTKSNVRVLLFHRK